MIITDTGFWLALRNRNDKYHMQAIKCAQKYKKDRWITTWPVMTEICHLLTTRLSVEDELGFLRLCINDAFDIYELSATEYPRMLDLIDKYRDLPMDLADASLVVLAEHLGSGRIFSTDQRDFSAYRWKNRKPFKNLLLFA